MHFILGLADSGQPSSRTGQSAWSTNGCRLERLSRIMSKEVRMLEIRVTLSADQERVMQEARKLEHEGVLKIQEHIPTLTLTVPDHRNDEKVIAALAMLARKGFVTEFKSRW